MGNLIVERMRDKHPRWGPKDDEFHADGNTHYAGINPVFGIDEDWLSSLGFWRFEVGI